MPSSTANPGEGAPSTETNGVKQTEQTSPGGLCEVKAYEVRYDRDNQPTRISVSGKAKGSEQESDRTYALVSEKCYDAKSNLIEEIIHIKSQHILAALRQVVDDYTGVNLHTSEVTLFDGPKIFFHYRDQLRRYQESLDDVEANEHLELALDFLRQEYRRQIQVFDNLHSLTNSAASMDHANLWMVFCPGKTVFATPDDQPEALKFESMKICPCSDVKHAGEWKVKVTYVTHDGDRFGYARKSIYIPPFPGSKKISDLPVYPLKYHENEDDASSQLMRRGRRFACLSGIHHGEYQGLAYELSNKRRVNIWGEEEEYDMHAASVSGRVMIDAKSFGRFRAPNRVQLIPEMRLDSKASGPDALSDDELLLCDSRVPSFSLVTKNWLMCYVDFISDISFNTEAFDSLLLPDSQKSIVLSLVKAKETQGSGFDDLIQGKGKGLIFVLHGVPGVGKTLTAESVAEYTERPLYVISSGELGTKPDTVEENLRTALTLATTWKAIILLDESDVFLEQRSVHDMVRNCLVSLFLRVLEYYEGIMFLTSNRINTFDVAFKSRIHVALKYNALDTSARRELWRMFVKRGSADGDTEWLDGESLDTLAAEDLNGRQIKNAVRTAYALAHDQGKALSMIQLETVLEVARAFERDFQGMDVVGNLA
ncbi:MAG: hypothetical protein M1833_005770 [Piccolia ochrophora]|nr:MAG: hypothetical protein M1833_005770 [Piccolia ochrophora]